MDILPLGPASGPVEPFVVDVAAVLFVDGVILAEEVAVDAVERLRAGVLEDVAPMEGLGWAGEPVELDLKDAPSSLEADDGTLRAGDALVEGPDRAALGSTTMLPPEPLYYTNTFRTCDVRCHLRVMKLQCR